MEVVNLDAESRDLFARISVAAEAGEVGADHSPLSTGPTPRASVPRRSPAIEPTFGAQPFRRARSSAPAAVASLLVTTTGWSAIRQIALKDARR